MRIRHSQSSFDKKKLRILFSVLVILSILTPALIYLPRSVFAATCTWSGGSGNWEDSGNWSNCGGGVPGSGDDVEIDASVTVNLNATTTINSLTLGNISGTTSPTLNFNYDAITDGALIVDGGDLTAYSSSVITHSDAYQDTVVGMLYIDVMNGDINLNGATINTDYKGYEGGPEDYPGYGPGGGKYPVGTSSLGTGGSYGGLGELSNYYFVASDRYGNVYTPDELGSGGAASYLSDGGDGGGAIKLECSGTLNIIDSIITSDGEGGHQFSSYSGGGGSGGAIFLEANSISFDVDSVISAEGGTNVAASYGAAGGGGRIAINYYNAFTNQGTISADKGSANNSSGGRDGTIIYRYLTTNDIYIARDQIWDSAPELEGFVHNFNSFNVVDGATLTLKGYYTTNTDGIGFKFNVNDFFVESGATINLTGQGYAGGDEAEDGSGLNPGIFDRYLGAGGGHGGQGKNSSSFDSLGGVANTSPIKHLDLGSGGSGASFGRVGGAGGGAIYINANDDVTINGSIIADGNAGTQRTSYGAGGGSGGSIFVTCEDFVGGEYGIIAARGGAGGDGGSSSTRGGGGGGGIIQILYRTSGVWNNTSHSLTPSVATAQGANGVCTGDCDGIVNFGEMNAGYIVNLDPGLSAVSSSNPQIDLTNPSNATVGNTSMYIRDAGGDIVSRFSIIMNGNRDFNNVTADINSTKAFFHISSGDFRYIDGFDAANGTFSLYVPKDDRDTAVRICPGADDFSEITVDCAGGTTYSETDDNVSVVELEGSTYWKVDGLVNTGGLGINTSGTPNMRVDLANEATSASDDIEVWFDTPTDITADSLLYIIYDSLFTGGSSLTASDISLNCDDDGEVGGTSTGMTAFSVNTADNGYLVLDTNTDTCSNWIQVDIQGGGGNHLTNPVSPGNYSWAVLTDVSGDGADDDSGATLAYVGDDNDVNITAIVPPTIDMELYQQGTDTELTDTNTCALGVLSLNQVNTCIYDLGTGTNNSTGVSVYMTSDGSLDDGNGNIIGSPTGAVTSGEEEYGFYLSELGGGEYTAAGSYSTQHQAVPTSATLIASSSTTGSGTTAGSSIQHLEITHAASMSTSTIVGSYNQVVTYTAYTN